MSAWVGVASSSIEPHVYSVRDNKTTLFALPSNGKSRMQLFSITIMLEFYSKRNDILEQVTTYLWQRYGQRCVSMSIQYFVAHSPGWLLVRVILNSTVLMRDHCPHPSVLHYIGLGGYVAYPFLC